MLTIQRCGVLVIIPKYSHEQLNKFYSYRKHTLTSLTLVSVQVIEHIAFILNYPAF
jgi:hypothetical protein